jgi:hypothetical protein
MSKKVPVVTVARADAAAEREGLAEEVTLALAARLCVGNGAGCAVSDDGYDHQAASPSCGHRRTSTRGGTS